jgi:hypothetical protein
MVASGAATPIIQPSGAWPVYTHHFLEFAKYPNENAHFTHPLPSFTRLLSYTKKMCGSEVFIPRPSFAKAMARRVTPIFAD